MTRGIVFAAGLVAAFAVTARADLPVAPPPRPAGQPAGPAEDPAAVVERIITNSKTVTEKLAKTETGEPTQSTQATILKDIDALIKRQEDSPPSGGGGGGGGGGGQGQASSGMGKSGGQPMGGQGGGGGQGGQQAKGRKPRGSGKKDSDQDKDMASAGGKKDSKAEAGKADCPDPKDGKGATAGRPGGGEVGKPVPRPTVPLDDEVAKEVWGHLPDKVRQQVTQYYKEEFMPRYAGLLKQYYSSLATTPGKSGEMRK